MNSELLVTIVVGLVLANIINMLVVNPILGRVLGGSKSGSRGQNLTTGSTKSN